MGGKQRGDSPHMRYTSVFRAHVTIWTGCIRTRLLPSVIVDDHLRRF